MDSIRMDKVCRGCMREEPEMRLLFATEQPRLDQMLVSSTQLPISKDDGLPYQICLHCTHQLSTAFTFKQMCERSDARLRKYMTGLKSSSSNSSQDLTASVKEERNIQPTVDDSNSIFKPIQEVTQIKEEHESFENLSVIDFDVKMTVSFNGETESNDNINDLNEKSTQTRFGDPNPKAYNCIECGKIFSTLIGLTNHLKWRHSSKDMVCCKECDKIFTKFSQYKKHCLEIHGQDATESRINELECLICKSIFEHISKLKNHMLLHGKKKIYNCTNCDHGFNKYQNYEKHKSHCHPPVSKDVEPEINPETNLHNHHHNNMEFLETEMTIKEEPLDELLEEAERQNSMANSNGIDDDYNDADFNLSDYEKDNSDGSDYIDGRRKTKQKLKRSFRSSRKHKLGKREHRNGLKSSPDLDLVSMDDVLKEHFPEKIHKCNTCNKTFNRHDRLVRHMWCHTDNKPFPCDMCEKGFIRSEHLIRHKIALHSNKQKNPKKAFCTICSRGFTTEKYLETHMRMHTGDKTYMCKICLKTFNTKWHLNEHSKWHSAEKPFLCSECGQTFIRNDYLVTHMRRHRGEKPYKCRYCKKGFPRATDLTVHERYHTGEKTHLCTICGKGFQRQYNLTVHLRVHTGEKPYGCSFCGKKFAQGNDLKSHVRRHTGERFNCEVCGEGFIQGYHLTQHKRSIHGIQCNSHIRRVQKHPQSSLKKDNSTSGSTSTDIMNVVNTKITSESEEKKPIVQHVNGNVSLQCAEMDLSQRAQTVPALMPIVPLALFPSMHTRT